MHPIPLNERISYLYLERGRLRVTRHSLVWVAGETSCVLPVARLACLLLGPGSSVTHDAVRYCADGGVHLFWVGEGCTRFYAAGAAQEDHEKLAKQVRLAESPSGRLEVVRRLFRLAFDRSPPSCYSVQQIRGLEGTLMRELYAGQAEKWGVDWTGRSTDSCTDHPNKIISMGNSMLYAISETVIRVLGYSTSVGFSHRHRPRAFVYDLADTVKGKSWIPTAMRLASRETEPRWGDVSRVFRDMAQKENLMKQLASNVEHLLDVKCRSR